MEQIEGRQPVREALRAGRPIRRILVAEGGQTRGALADILSLARAAKVRVDRVPRAAIDARATTRAHQGVIAEAAPYRTRSWRDALAEAQAAGRVALVLALDGIEDPQNLGALLRSAEVFGVDAVLLPKRRSAPLGPAVAKASAGALEHLAIDLVPNIERALSGCRAAGIWVVALAAEGDQDLGGCDLLGEPVALVIGSEATGVGALIRRRADAVVRIPTWGRVGSLNASAAGAVALWEAARRRPPVPGMR